MGCSEINICAAPTGTEEVHRFVFVLCTGFSSLDLGGALETLAAANDVSSKTVFEWEIASEKGDQVQASSGITVAVDRTLSPTHLPVTFRNCTANTGEYLHMSSSERVSLIRAEV